MIARRFEKYALKSVLGACHFRHLELELERSWKGGKYRADFDGYGSQAITNYYITFIGC